MSTGICRRERRSVSATARSSPKLGRVTMMPSRRSLFARNSAAQRLASSCDSTAPYLLCCASRTTASIPAWLRALIMSSRPDLARWSGKNPRLPTITPMVSFLRVLGMCLLPRRAGAVSFLPPAWNEMVGIDDAQEKEQASPPDAGVQVIKNNPILRRMRQFVESGSKDQPARHHQAEANEEPNRDGASGNHRIYRTVR